MTTPHAVRTMLFAVLSLAMLGPLASPAAAQADLRRENEQLKARVNDLKADLEAARERISELEQEIRRLRDQVEVLRRQTDEQPQREEDEPEESEPETSIDESNPAASPRALRAGLERDYEETFADLTFDEDDPREVEQYLRQVERWANRVNRQFRSQIAWTVRIERAEAAPRGAVLQLQAIDPATDQALGDPFPVTITRTLARRIDRQQRQDDPPAAYVLEGVLNPQVVVNPRRPERGTFDNPPLIGPFAEFGYFVNINSLRPVVDDDEDESEDEDENGDDRNNE